MTALAAALGVVAGVAVLGAAGPSAVPVERGDSARPRGLGRALSLAPRRLALAGLGALVLGLVAPPLAAVPIVAPALVRHRRARQARRAEARAVSAALPDTVDLLLLVAARAPAPVGAALRAADASAAAGQARADAILDALLPLGDRAAALAHVLGDHLRYGVPLVPGLERIGLELRLDRRRRAEEDIRRVPLRLLAPLLCCVLPAFGLLTIVPLLVASLRALPT
jgi:tight adherence protein C